MSLMLVLSIASCRSSEKTLSEESTDAVQNTQDNSQTNSDTIEAINSKIAESENARRDSLIQVYKDQIYNNNQNKANRITTFYILAQQKFYGAEYEEALFLINQASNIKETPDVLALKGSIYFGLGSTENFITFWKRALDMDKNLPIPPSSIIVEELKKHGLINEIPDRNFK